MDVVNHVIAVIQLIDGSIEIIYDGYTAGDGYVDFFQQIMRKRPVPQVSAAPVLVIAVCINGLGKFSGWFRWRCGDRRYRR